MLLLTFFAFLAHGLALINDGIYYDGWLFFTYLREQRWDMLSDFYSKNGLPQAALPWMALSLFADFNAAHKWIAWLSLLVAAALVLLIAREINRLTQWLSEREAYLIALISLIFPAVQTTAELSLLHYQTTLPIFLLGAYADLRSIRMTSVGRIGLRLAALVCFAWSFMNGGELVFYFGYLLLHALVVNYAAGKFSFRTFARYALTRIDLVLLPFVYWWLTRTYTPAHGVFGDYNHPSLSSVLTLSNWGKFLYYSVLLQIINAYWLLPMLIALPLLLISPLWRWLVPMPFTQTANSHRRIAIGLIVCGAFLLLMAMLPYVAVGKYVDGLHGYRTRHAMLVAIPIGILIVGVLRLIAARAQLTRWLIVSFALACVAANIDTYIAWQARYVRDRAIMSELSKLSGAAQTSVFLIDDQFDWNDRHAREIAPHAFYEWSIMLRQVFGAPANDRDGKIGFESGEFEFESKRQQMLDARNTPLNADINNPYFIGGADPDGCRATLTIRPTQFARGLSSFGMVQRYWLARFVRPSELPALLDGLVELSMQPVANCK